MPSVKADVRVIIEVPAGSLRKASFQDGHLVTEFLSPLPCPFNYGFAPDLGKSEDGEGADVIVLGGRLRAGSEVDVTPVLCVDFLDAGERDDKLVARADGRCLSRLDHALLRLFFWAYIVLKRLRRGVWTRRARTTRVLGFRPL